MHTETLHSTAACLSPGNQLKPNMMENNDKGCLRGLGVTDGAYSVQLIRCIPRGWAAECAVDCGVVQLQLALTSPSSEV